MWRSTSSWRLNTTTRSVGAVLYFFLLLGTRSVSSAPLRLPGAGENKHPSSRSSSHSRASASGISSGQQWPSPSCGAPSISSTSIASTEQNAQQQHVSIKGRITGKNRVDKIATALGVTSGGGAITITGEDDDGMMMIKASAAVGIITAAMGYSYGKILSFCVTTVWHTLPNMLRKNNNLIRPSYLIAGLCTLGGLLMGILSTALSSTTFTVADFVSIFSSSSSMKKVSLPPIRTHLMPLLLLSLVTSTFGFSVGPEAPMVCAGALIGAAVARYLHRDDDDNSNSNTNNEVSVKHQETLAYAGAAGALTAFMGIPIAGSIFALELTCPHAGMNEAAGGKRTMSSTIVSSIAALVVIRAFLDPSSNVGGHFDYGSVSSLGGRTAILAAIACGAGGGLLGTIFHTVVGTMKKIVWTANITNNSSNDNDGNKKNAWKRPLMVKTLIGLLVGIISANYPQTLFWGEGSLQTVIDGQRTAFVDTKHGLSEWMTSDARVNPSLPFVGAGDAAQVGVAKLLAIALACAGKFPGGIIFPLMFAAAPLAHSASSLLMLRNDLDPVVVMCLMASTQAAVTRTPLATALILSFTASAKTELSAMLPSMILSSYLGVYFSSVFSEKSYFVYN